MAKDAFEHPGSLVVDPDRSPFANEIPWLATTYHTSDKCAPGQSALEAAPPVATADAASSAKIIRDADQRISSISYANGKVRKFAYTGKEDQPSSVTSWDPSATAWRSFVRSQPNSWASLDAQGKTISVWQGEVRLRADGSYTTCELDERRVWTVFKPDGTAGKEKSTASGATAIFDLTDKLLRVRRTDGKVLSGKYQDGELQSITLSATGKDDSPDKVVWRKNKEGLWEQEGGTTPVRHKLRFNENGEYLFEDKDGTRHKERVDGHFEIAYDRGSIVEKDERGIIVKLRNSHGDYRTFEYEGDKIIGINDVTTAGGRKTWEASSGEERQDLKLSENGTLTYRTTNGTKIIDRSDLIRVACDNKERPKTVCMPDGSTRSYEYGEDGKLQRIQEQVKTKTGNQALVWLREGSSDSFNLETKNPDQPYKRLKVSVTSRGDFEFTLPDGVQRTSKGSDIWYQEKPISLKLQDARTGVRTRAKDAGADPSRTDEYISLLETRSETSRQAGLKAPSEEQLAGTYNQFIEMLSDQKGIDSFNRQQRAVLFKLAMHNIAQPMRIDQGGNETCNITTVEVYTASRQPDSYARLLKEITLTGEYTTSSGKKIKPPTDGFAPGVEEGAFRVETDELNQRNWASKVFQVTGVNIVIPFMPASNDAPPWGKPYSGGNPYMPYEQILDASKEINGSVMPYFGDRYAPTAEDLLARRKSGDLPVGIFTIHATDKTGFHGLHVQTIHDVRSINGKVEILLDDQRGEVNDGWLPISKLYDHQQLRPAEKKGSTAPQ